MSDAPSNGGSPTVILVHGAYAEVDGSHVTMISRPQAVSEVILEAIAAVG